MESAWGELAWTESTVMADIRPQGPGAGPSPDDAQPRDKVNAMVGPDGSGLVTDDRATSPPSPASRPFHAIAEAPAEGPRGIRLSAEPEGLLFVAVFLTGVGWALVAVHNPSCLLHMSCSLSPACCP